MGAEMLEAGRIVNTHGVRGMIKIEPWCDSAEFLKGFKRLYIGGERYDVLAASVHKEHLLASLAGVETLEDAIRLKGRVVSIARADAKLPKGRFFIADLIGMEVRDLHRGTLGEVVEVMTLPANNVYVVRGEKEYMIPAVDEFIRSTDLESRVITVEIIDGMEA